MDTSIEKLIELPPVDMMGPAMRKLNERQRRFVCALAVCGGQQREAYLWAGYDVKSIAGADASASRLVNSSDVTAAIKEEAIRRMDSSVLLAVSTLVELAGPKNVDQKLRAKAADSLLDRVAGFAGKTEHSLVIRDERTTAELIDFIKNTARSNGLDANKLLGLTHQPVIDAEFEVVGSDDGIADLL